ncbi:MAG: deoxyhypusine synthase [DPANN group archaeon]|nr:deoxyhypusine synthase [DPANN group archaeon]
MKECNKSMHGFSKINHVKTKKDMTVNELITQMSKSGVMGGGKIAESVDILEEMITNKDCKLFMGLAGAMVPGGMKQIIIDMLNAGQIDVFVTTGANLTHDLIEALGYNHYKGHANVDDKELNKKKINRIYDTFMHNDVYTGLEAFCKKTFDTFPKKELNITEFLWLLGDNVDCENSILKVCAKKRIPIFCPALSDSGIGLQVWSYILENKLKILAFEDMKEIIDIAWTAKKIGVFYIGGGVPKNYIQQSIQFSPHSAEYGVQITTDRPDAGGSSGAQLNEGISWGKLASKAKYSNITCDATIALPLISAALKERLE